MTMTRRDFMVVGAATAAVATTGGAARLAGADETETPKKEAVLKLGSQLGVIPGASTEEKLARMVEWGMVGVEWGGDIVGNEDRYIKMMADAGIQPSAICYGSLNGHLVSEDVSKRGPAKETLKRVIEAAGAIGSTGVIYVPAFNGQTQLRNKEIRDILVDALPELGEVAVRAGTRILLEPLNRGEAFFLRQLADAASICRDCKHPGVCMMGDFYHMTIEETSDMGAFISGGSYCHHVHLASRVRVLPGQDDRRYVDGFRGLKMIGYQDHCSFECGCRGDRMVEIPKSLQFLRDEWELATV